MESPVSEIPADLSDDLGPSFIRAFWYPSPITLVIVSGEPTLVGTLVVSAAIDGTMVSRIPVAVIRIRRKHMKAAFGVIRVAARVLKVDIDLVSPV